MTVVFEGLDNLEKLDKAIGQAPALVYFWVRDAFFGIAIDHRTRFLRTSGVKVNRRPSATRPNPIQAPKVNEAGAGFDLSRGIRWQVSPAEKRNRRARKADLEAITLEVASDNDILEFYERGGTIRPRRGSALAIPIAVNGRGRGRRSPWQFRQKNPKSELIAKKSKESGATLLFERKRKRTGERERLTRTKSGKVRTRQKKTFRDVLIPRWVLRPSIRVRARLRFYDAFDSTDSKQQKRLQTALDRIVRDLARGVTD